MSYVWRSCSISPSHSQPIVRASSPATSVPSVAAISEARDSRKSPARMACRLPHLALTVSTPRRVSASSITSSWYSDPRWTSSQATPPRTTSSDAGVPPTWAAVMATTGRRRLPPATTRWEAISVRYGSELRTASCSATSIRPRSASIDANENNGDRTGASDTSGG